MRLHAEPSYIIYCYLKVYLHSIYTPHRLSSVKQVLASVSVSGLGVSSVTQSPAHRAAGAPAPAPASCSCCSCCSCACRTRAASITALLVYGASSNARSFVAVSRTQQQRSVALLSNITPRNISTSGIVHLLRDGINHVIPIVNQYHKDNLVTKQEDTIHVQKV